MYNAILIDIIVNDACVTLCVCSYSDYAVLFWQWWVRMSIKSFVRSWEWIQTMQSTACHFLTLAKVTLIQTWPMLMNSWMNWRKVFMTLGQLLMEMGFVFCGVLYILLSYWLKISAVKTNPSNLIHGLDWTGYCQFLSFFTCQYIGIILYCCFCSLKFLSNWIPVLVKVKTICF